MISLKDLNESHDVLKSIAVSLILIPFWYVAIFLFNNDFYKSADHLIVFAMCFSISLISSFLTSFVLIGLKCLDQKKMSGLEIMFLSVLFLCFFLSLQIFLFYSARFLFNGYLHFYWFLIVHFIFPLVIFLFFEKKEKYKSN